MESMDLHSTLFEKSGGPVIHKDACKIWLKRRHTGSIYMPALDERAPGAMYPRAVVLEHSREENGTILCTFEQYTEKTPVFPIFASKDGGLTWELRSQVEDRESGFGCRFQPHLFELPCSCGSVPEGTLLCAGNIIPGDFSSTSLRLYESRDGGRTWSYMSEIISGGRAWTDHSEAPDENRPVWEPFLYTTKTGDLICFYSDERFQHSHGYNQLLAHKVSRDGGYTWEEAVVDVAMPGGVKRPGMPIIAPLPDGRYIMVYEIVNVDGIPVVFRISDDIENWGDPAFLGNPVRASDGSYLSGTPYVAWIPQGGEHGTILVTGRGFGGVLANSQLGKGPWEKLDGLADTDIEFGRAGAAYSRCILPIHGGRQILLVTPLQVAPRLSQIRYGIADVYAKCE